MKRRSSTTSQPRARALAVATPIQAFSRGPKKKRREGPPKPRHSTHKQRSSWFRWRNAWPLREAPVRR